MPTFHRMKHRCPWLTPAGTLLWRVFPTWVGWWRRLTIDRTRVVAVVGSYAKSTTTRAIKTALGEEVETRPRSNYGFGLAVAVLRRAPWKRWAVFEVGIRKPGEMRPMANMLQPDYTVFTSVGVEHLTFMKSQEVTRREKSWMVSATRADGKVFLNGDDQRVLQSERLASCATVRLGFGEQNEIRIMAVDLVWPRGMDVHLCLGQERVRIQSKLLGQHWALPLAMAVGVAREMGVAPELAAQRLAELEPTRGRMQHGRLENGAWVIRDDAQNGFDTARAALDALKEIPADRKWVVFGSTPDLPEPRAGSLEQLGQRLAEVADGLVVLDEADEAGVLMQAAVAAGLTESRVRYAGDSRQAATDLLPADLGPRDLVLLKGATHQRLGKIFCLLNQRILQ